MPHCDTTREGLTGKERNGIDYLLIRPLVPSTYICKLEMQILLSIISNYFTLNCTKKIKGIIRKTFNETIFPFPGFLRAATLSKELS